MLHHATGEYEELPGWDEDITEAREEADLPQAARDYLAFIADFVDVPIALIGVGAGREQIIWTEAGRDTAAGRASRSPAAGFALADRRGFRLWANTRKGTRSSRAGVRLVLDYARVDDEVVQTHDSPRPTAATARRGAARGRR